MTNYIVSKIPRNQAGLSLIELMISLTIGVLLLLGISTLLVEQNKTRAEMEKSSRQIENGRYAMQLLRDDIQLAGYYGEYSPALGVASATTMDPCDPDDLGWNAAVPLAPVPIFGYAGAAADPTPGACLDNYLPNTDVLVLRRTSTADPVAPAAAVAGTPYLQVSRCNTDPLPFVLGTGGFTMHQMDCQTTPPGTLATLLPFIVRIYYLSSCSVCGSDSIPTLKMVEIADGVRTTTPLVEGIEILQFDYGIDGDNNADGVLDDISGDGVVNALDRDGAPDSYTDVPPVAASWENVMAVKVNLLARNNETTPNHTDTKSYDMGLAGVVSPGGTYKRHAYNQLVRAINPSGRRE